MIGAEDVVRAWDLATFDLHGSDSGLINATWIVGRPGHVEGILQRLNTAIFSPLVHEDIAAVTAHLAAKGLPTPRIIPTAAGGLWHTDAEGGVWRMLTPVGDRTVERLERPEDAEIAGDLVARFHAATADLAWAFRAVRGGFHDTGLRMAQLRDALDAHRGHRLYDRVAPLSDALSTAWDGLRSEAFALPTRIIHGDLKISNVRFSDRGEHALIDLDTLGHGTLDAELGDAFRSWCNRGLEDDPDGRFDAALFAAGISGYARGAAGVTADERAAIVPGVVRIATELSARFAADALSESYFGWDARRYATRGEHNLARAVGQAALARAAAEQRGVLEAHVTSAFARAGRA